MNKRKLVTYSLASLAGLALAYQVSAKAMALPDLFQGMKTMSFAPHFASNTGTGCTNQPVIAGLETATNPNLRRLAKYQALCNSGVSKTLMIFTGIPTSTAEAAQSATYMAGVLQEFARFGVRPLIIVEPVGEKGDVDMKALAAGSYDQYIAAYFAGLRQAGVSEAQSGLWVPLPEANVPLWSPRDRSPDTFAQGVNHYLLAAHQTYPHLEASVMLNVASYPPDDETWDQQRYVSLAPYLHGIQKGLVQSVGLQGFPWLPPANEPGPNSTDPSVFLDARIAKDAADTLGVKTIWFNTGTFAAQHTNSFAERVSMSEPRRSDLLQGVTSQALLLKKQGYDVAVNLFAENKSNVAEETDWSYFGSAETLLQNTIGSWYDNGIRLWLFDSE